MSLWKIELTWHDHVNACDRKYRTVVEAKDFDDARKDAIGESGVYGGVICSEGQPFNDFEYANVEASKRRFINGGVRMSPRS